MTAAAEAETVACQVRDGIAWVKFNRPDKRNCMSPKLNRQMLRVLDELEFRDDVGVLVLTGEGSAWSAGMDLKEYFRETEALGLRGVRHAQREAYAWWERLRWYQKVTIAMVNGWCFGGGYGPLFACDLAVLRRRGAIWPFRNQLGHPARRRCDQGGRGPDADAQGDVPRVARRESDRTSRPQARVWSMNRCPGTSSKRA